MSWSRTGRGLLLLIMGMIIFTVGVSAEELSLAEIIDRGIDNNFALAQLRAEVESGRNRLEALYAELGWQVDVSSSYQVPGGSGVRYGESDQVQVQLAGEKGYLSGLTLETGVLLTEKQETKDNLSFQLGFTQRLYPDTPVMINDLRLESQLLAAENNLKTAGDELLYKEKELMIGWIASFLKMINQRERWLLTERKYELAENNLQLVQRRQALGETGDNQILAARIRLKETELALQESRQEYNRIRKKFYRDTGLKPGITLKLNRQEEYLKEVRHRIEPAIDRMEREKMLMMARENSLILERLQREIELVKKELAWQRDEDKVRLEAGGSIGFQDDETEWRAGVELSYNLTDGGRREINLREKKSQLARLEEEYRYTLSGLKLNLSELMDNLEVMRLSKEKQEINRERVRLETSLFKRQYKQGLIAESQLIQQLNKEQLSEIEYLEAVDDLLTARLRLYNFLGLW